MAKSYREVPGLLMRLDLDPKERIEEIIQVYKNTPNTQGFEEAFMQRHLKVISATAAPTASATFEMVADREFCSRMDTMQGGAVALVLDLCTSFAVASIARKGFWDIAGVSRTLSVTYLRPIKVNTNLVIECEVLQIGNRLATIHGRITDKDTKKLLAVAEHNKASISGDGKL